MDETAILLEEAEKDCKLENEKEKQKQSKRMLQLSIVMCFFYDHDCGYGSYDLQYLFRRFRLFDSLVDFVFFIWFFSSLFCYTLWTSARMDGWVWMGVGLDIHGGMIGEYAFGPAV